MNSQFQLVLKFVIHRRLRSFLTTLGIAIGVMLVFSLVSVNKGMVSAISESLDDMGGDIITITPKMSGTFTSSTFSNDEILALRKLPFVREVAGIYSTVFPIEIRGQEEYLAVYGYDSQEFSRILDEMQIFSIERGRNFRPGETGKVIIGYKIAEDYHLDPGAQILISDKEFRIIGVLQKIGNSEDDSSINTNVKDLWALTGEDNTYNYILTTVSEMNDERITRELKKVRGQEDFDVYTPESFMEKANDILNIVNLVFLAVASISIVVGAIGVANTMYMAIFERTREIGIMKAVGASEKEILVIFIVEAGILSLFGGLLGILIGGLLAWGMGYAATVSGTEYLRPIFTWDTFVFTLLFSFLIGVVAGFFPAKYASELEPVEALRYE